MNFKLQASFSLLQLQHFDFGRLEIMADVPNSGYMYLEITLNMMSEKLPDLLSRDATSLKEVRLFEFDEHCDDDFEKFLTHYSHLEVLMMKGNFPLSDDHLKIIAGRLKKLRSLQIAMDTSITDVGLDYLSGESDLGEEVSCPLLEDLYIWRAYDITGEGILSIGSGLKNLKHLNLWVNDDVYNDNVSNGIVMMKKLLNIYLRNECTGETSFILYSSPEEDSSSPQRIDGTGGV